MFDIAAGEPAYEDPPKREKGRGKSNRGRSVNSPSQQTAIRPSQQKPAEVSDHVWGLAEHFLELGKAFFGRNIPVNRAEFSKRLSERINTDPDVHAMLRPLEWNDKHRLVRTRLPQAEHDKRVERINDIVAEMISLFWSRLEAGAPNSGAIQFRFLDDDWGQLWYDAVTNLEVRKLVEGLETGETKRVPANYRMVSQESQDAHRMKRLQIRLRNQQDAPDRPTVTDEDRATFDEWVAERNETRGSVAN